MTPELADKLAFSIWTLKDTDASCDLCSRPARFAVFNGKRDFYSCVSHTARFCEAGATTLRVSRRVAAS